MPDFKKHITVFLENRSSKKLSGVIVPEVKGLLFTATGSSDLPATLHESVY